MASNNTLWSRAPGKFWQVLVAALVICAGLATYFGMDGMADSSLATAGEPVCEWETVGSYNHDADAFTQGLVWHDQRLFESTGQYGHSTLREVELETGKVIRKIDLNERFFGEGIAILNDRVFQVTWRENRAFQYDLETFEKQKKFKYPGEGWGLTHDGTSLILSDGTPVIRFLDPETFEEQKRITVTSDRGLIKNLNELEYVDGAIFANIWQTGIIVRFDANSGTVLNWIDTRDILGPRVAPGVMNGIAWIEERQSFLLTGKNWPLLFEVKVDCPH